MNIKAMIKKYNDSSDTLKASLWYTVCNVLNKGFSLMSTPVFTRILTEEEYGTFAVFQSWFNILIIFTSLNIFLSGYTKGLLKYKGNEEKYTSVSLTQTSLITIFFVLVYLLNKDFWTGFFELPPVLMVGMFMELLLMPALDFWVARKRFDYQYKQYVAMSLSMSFLALSIGIVAVLLSKDKLFARVYSDVIVKSVFSLVAFVFIIVKGKKIFDKEYFSYNFKFNLPLIPHYLSNYVLSQSDRLMISKMIGNAQAAIYSVAYTISTMMNIIVVAINNALTPFIYKSLEKKEYDKIKRSTNPLFFIVLALCIFTMAFAPEIIFVFAGKKYMEAIYVIPPIAGSVFFFFLYAMFSTIEYYYQKTGYIATATTISAVVNIVLNYIFIGLFGYYAAGYTTLICYMMLAAAHYVLYKKVMEKECNEKVEVYNGKLIFVTSVILIAIMLLLVTVYSIIWIRYAILLIMAVVAVIKKDKIMDAVGNLKK